MSLLSAILRIGGLSRIKCCISVAYFPSMVPRDGRAEWCVVVFLESAPGSGFLILSFVLFQACQPAAMMALEDVNKRMDLLPGYRLKLHWNDSEVRHLCPCIFLCVF